MTPTMIEKCLTLLEAMPAGRDQDVKWPQLSRLYSMVLTPMQDREAMAACEWMVANERWRPAPSDIRRIAARIAAPYPDDDEAYAEILFKLAEFGEWGVVHPERPNVRLAGQPPMSHPVVASIVRYCGGWEMLCSGEAQMQEGLKKQVRSAHESVAGKWETEVASQLTLPPARRDPLFFRSYKRCELPVGWTTIDAEARMAALPPIREPQYTEMPEQVKSLVRGLLREMPSA